MAMLIVQCDTCGNDIRKHHTRVGKNNFCNRNCYLEFHSVKKEIKNCEMCGTDFEVENKRNSNRFCSRGCYDAYHNIQNKSRTCPTCGEDFIAKSSEDKYCCWECYNNDRHMPEGEDHWNWQGGKSEEHRNSNKSKRWRLAVYKKDNYSCQKCGCKEKLNAHHIYSWAHYEDLRYDINNGITLCEDCHKNIHKQYGYNTKVQML